MLKLIVVEPIDCIAIGRIPTCGALEYNRIMKGNRGKTEAKEK